MARDAPRRLGEGYALAVERVHDPLESPAQALWPCFQQQTGNRVIAEGLLRRDWTEKDLAARLKNDPAKLRIATRVRTETTLSIKWIAARLQLGTSKSARAMLHQWMHTNEKPPKPTICAQLQFQPMADPFLRDAAKAFFLSYGNFLLISRQNPT
jgi:hypothetical protein